LIKATARRLTLNKQKIVRKMNPVRTKIIFLTPHINTPSTRFRVLQNIPELEKNAFDITIHEIPKGIFARKKLFDSLPSYDIVFLQKKTFQRFTFYYLRRKSKILIYDFDDAVMFRDSNAAYFHSPSNLSRFRNILKHADVVVSGNEYLKNLAMPHATKVVVIPTGIDTQTYARKSSSDISYPMTIGWIGSKPNLIYLKQLIEPVNKLYTMTKNFRVKIVCDDFIDGFACPVEKKIWKKEDEVTDIQSFDIGVMPLLNDQWTKGKCALKLLQYMSCGLASVSSDTDVTSSIIRDGINGFLASSDSQWIEKTKFLFENPDKLITIGNKARKSIEGNYDSKTTALKYAAVFDHVSG